MDPHSTRLDAVAVYQPAAHQHPQGNADGEQGQGQGYVAAAPAELLGQGLDQHACPGKQEHTRIADHADEAGQDDGGAEEEFKSWLGLHVFPGLPNG